MRCLPFFHRWQLRGVRPIIDVSFGKPGMHFTELLLACTRCPKLKVRRIPGEWTWGQLSGQIDDPQTP